MGPAIIVDKSTLQSLSPSASRELRRYFYLNVPPVLLSEVLADLSKDLSDDAKCVQTVRTIARKASPPDSIVNADYRSLCHSELLGNPEPVRQDRRPIVLGARRVTLADGRRGVNIGLQPENEALCRWMAGKFEDIDRKFALSWRKSIETYDLEGFKKTINIHAFKGKTLEELGDAINLLFEDSEVQDTLLSTILTEIRMIPEARKWALDRWRTHGFPFIRQYSPYNSRCLYVNMFLYLGVPSGIIGTRNSNRIDIEYFYYTPFACVFSSGDKLHQQLSPYLLDADQSFIPRDELLRSLNEIAKARETNPHAEPPPDSLIVELWKRHWGSFYPQAQPRTPQSDAQRKKSMADIQPLLDAMQQDDTKRPPSPRWPI